MGEGFLGISKKLYFFIPWYRHTKGSTLPSRFEDILSNLVLLLSQASS